MDSYESRRRFFREVFEPLLSGLERFDAAPLDAMVQNEVATLDSAAWGKAIVRRFSDPDGAITAARTLLESVCKTILDDIPTDPNDPYEGKHLPGLYRRLAKELRMAPSEHSDRDLKQILQGCVSVVHGLASVRNRASDAHGQGRRGYRVAERHAALAVNAAGAVATFLVQTSKELGEHYAQIAADVEADEAF